jgi:hypothetical protein
MVFFLVVFLLAVMSESGPSLACLELVERRQIVLPVSPEIDRGCKATLMTCLSSDSPRQTRLLAASITADGVELCFP